MAKTPKDWQPSPFISTWWGALGDTLWKGRYHKRGAQPVTRKKHRTDTHKTHHQKCPCDAFRLCDLYYQNMPANTKAEWKAALKKPALSAYTLFMKECICTAVSSGKYPDCPSVSGGFSCRSVIEGAAIDEEGFIGRAPPVRYTCTGSPDYECVPDPGGEYDTLEACEANCVTPCGRCGATTPYIRNVLIEGLTGTCAFINGGYYCKQAGSNLPCEWWYTFENWKLRVWYPNSTFLRVSVSNVDGRYIIWYAYSPTGHGCYLLKTCQRYQSLFTGCTVSGSTATVWADPP